MGNKEELVLDFLPAKPQPPAPDAADLLLDPPLEAVGLASWYPPGRVQFCLDWLHTHLDINWCGAIFLTTAMLRLLVFPLVVMSQKNVAKMNNVNPQMQALQQQISDARRRGDAYDSTRVGMELQNFMKEKGINPIKNMVPVFGQFPVFLSMFMGLRGMANLPLESFMTGGMLWFPDLTVPDPYYCLPLLTASTLYLQLKFAADGMDVNQVGPIGKLFFKVMPVMVFFFTMNFPAALTFYWLSTNVISVCQARLIRSGRVRKVLGVPEFIKWEKKDLPMKSKGVMETLREVGDNWKVQADIADRRAFDEEVFRKAGAAKPPRTFKLDPSKSRGAV